MPTVMITGANRGLGLEFARQYAADGWQVIAACRDPAQAGELGGLGKAVEIVALEVTDFSAIAQLGERLKGRIIDVLINNAGVIGTERNIGQLDGDRWMTTLCIDTVAPLLIAQSLLANLRAGKDKKAIFITSRMGSIADNTSGRYYDYRAAKAGLNAAVKSFAIDTAGDRIIAAVIHPGWVQTDMGGPGAAITVDQSVTGMLRELDALTLADTGTFRNWRGGQYPW